MYRVFSIVLGLLLMFAIDAWATGWLFDPGNKKDCVEKFRGDASNMAQFKTVTVGCEIWFGEGDRERVGKCVIKRTDQIKSDAGLNLLVAACSCHEGERKCNNTFEQNFSCLAASLEDILTKPDMQYVVGIKCKK
jgi:hypothetical protein